MGLLGLIVLSLITLMLSHTAYKLANTFFALQELVEELLKQQRLNRKKDE